MFDHDIRSDHNTLLLIHALGDTPSPKIIGVVSDHTTLSTGLGVTLVTMVLAAVLLFLGSRTISAEPTHDEATAEALPAH